MSLKKYPFGQDYGNVVTRNQNFKLQVKVIDRLLKELVALVREYMTKIIAQTIHDEVEQEFQNPADRKIAEWFQAEHMLLRAYGTDFMNYMNAALECLLKKTRYVMMQRNQNFPSPGTTLVALEDDTYEAKKSFIYYLQGLSGPDFAQLLRLAIDEEAVRITLEDVKICLGEELRELFEREVQNIHEPWEE